MEYSGVPAPIAVKKKMRAPSVPRRRSCGRHSFPGSAAAVTAASASVRDRRAVADARAMSTSSTRSHACAHVMLQLLSKLVPAWGVPLHACFDQVIEVIPCIVDVHWRLEVPALWPHGCHGGRSLGRARTSCAQAGQRQNTILFN